MTSSPQNFSTRLHGREGAWNKWGAALLCALAGFGVFQFFGNGGRGYIDTASLFYWWGFQWFNEGSESEHGPLILVLSIWLFWRNLRAQPPSGASGAERPTAAALIMIGGFALHALGYTVEQARISIVALLVFTWGLLRLAGGRRWAKAAAFPLVFLLFALPVNFLDSAGFYLRVWVIDAAHALAQAAGIEVIRNGTQLFSPGGSYQYDVAAACSGVRSLMALMALSLLTAYLNLHSWWRRAGVFLLCFPLTYLGNVVRISAIIFAGEWFGQQAGVWVHDWAGFLVFLVVLGGIFAAVSGWRRWSDEERLAPPSVSSEEIHNVDTSRGPARPWWVVPASVVAMALATSAYTTRVDDWIVVGRAGVALDARGENPAELPAFIGADWIGQQLEITEVERQTLPPDTGYSRRNYVAIRDRQEQVFVSIVLSGRDRTSIHRPELCLVGQGWSIVGQGSHQFRHPLGGEVPATVLRITREMVNRRGERQVVPALFAYWFVGGEAIEPTHRGRLWRTAVNRLRGQSDRWAYVVVQSPALDGENAALERMQTVLTGTLPAFMPAPLPEVEPLARLGEEG